MGQKGKKRNEYEEEGEEAEEEGFSPPPKKAARKSSGGGVTDGILVCEISKNRKVSVRSWQGKTVVDIREFYTKDGKELPGKKVGHVANRNKEAYMGSEAAPSVSHGSFSNILVRAPLESSLKELYDGISLPLDQWKILKDHIDRIEAAVTENSM